MKLPTFFAVIGLGFSSVSVADTVLDEQVNQFFAQGIKHCKNAMALSRTSREVAAAEFDRYKGYIGKVEALKPELKDDVMIQRQMEQCDQVGHDIARNEALPVFEQGLATCKEVKGYLRGDYLTKAKAKFLEYAQLRDQALGMTDTVLKVGSNASKVRRCDRLEEKIIAAEQRVNSSEIKADRLLSTLRKSNDSCVVTQRMLEKVGDNVEKLNAAEDMLTQARDYFKQTQNYPEAIARAENYPGYESSKKIRSYMLEYSRCEQNVAAVLGTQKQIFAKREAAQQQAQLAAAQQQAAMPAEVLVEQSSSDTEPVLAQQADQPVPQAELVEENQRDEIDSPYAQGLVQMDHAIE